MRRITPDDLVEIIGMSVEGYCVEDARVKNGDKIDTENYGIILAKNNVGMYVTWEFCFRHENISAYWGHYFNNRERALIDFKVRDLDEKAYNVTITETLKKTVIVEAKNRTEAEQIVSDKWRNSKYVLDADNFVGVEFSAEETDEVEDED